MVRTVNLLKRTDDEGNEFHSIIFESLGYRETKIMVVLRVDVRGRSHLRNPLSGQEPNELFVNQVADRLCHTWSDSLPRPDLTNQTDNKSQADVDSCRQPSVNSVSSPSRRSLSISNATYFYPCFIRTVTSTAHDVIFHTFPLGKIRRQVGISTPPLHDAHTS